MKKNKELDVDVIGGQGPLTDEESKMISAFIKAQKAKRNAIAKKTVRKKRPIANA